MWECCFDQSESVQSEEMRTEMVMRCDVKEEDWTWEMAKKEKGVEGGQVWGIEVRTWEVGTGKCQRKIEPRITANLQSTPHRF